MSTRAFKARAELVLVPAFVEQGAVPVRGLHKSDFAVFEDGEAQQIAVFEEIAVSSDTAGPAPVPDGEFTNLWNAESEHPRVLILVLDLFTEWSDIEYARQKLFAYFSGTTDVLPPTALMVRDVFGLHLVHDFTSDPQALAAALGTVRTGGATRIAHWGDSGDIPAHGAPERELPCSGRCEVTATRHQNLGYFRDLLDPLRIEPFYRESLQPHEGFSQLRAIAYSCRGIPGDKALVWVGSWSYSFRDELESPWPRRAAEARDAWRLLNEARIAIYPISAEGLVAPTGGGASEWNSRAGEYFGMRRIAEETGGRAFYGLNDIGLGFQRAVQDMSHYYLLGYYRKHRDPEPKWHKLSVIVRGKGRGVRSRIGFFSDPGRLEVPDVIATDAEVAMASPLQFTALPLRVRLRNVADSGRTGIVEYDVVIPPAALSVGPGTGNHVSFDILMQATNEHGRLTSRLSKRPQANLSAESVEKLQAGGLTYTGRVQLASGRYTLRFVVTDLVSARIGSVNASFTVQ